MSERNKTISVIVISLVAISIIAAGLLSSPAAAPTAEDRVASLSAAIKCPFCNGESLADSGSGVAADYRALIAERVSDGATDDEIRAEFAARFGDSYILDTSTSGWSIALWVIPLVALVGGGIAVLLFRRSSAAEEPAEQTGGISGRAVAGSVVVGLSVVVIGIFAVTSLSSGTSEGAEGVVGAVVSGDGPVDLSTITNEQMEAVVAENPDVVGMRLALARRYFEEGTFDKALDHYFEVLDREQHPEALANVGWMTYLSDRPDIAVGYVEQALVRRPDYLAAKWFLSNIYVTLGRPLDAVPLLVDVAGSAETPADVKDAALQLMQQIDDAP
ncbi:MAG: cytochrome c-type biogenesis protein CcmH [Acidimicrobiia bacterium]